MIHPKQMSQGNASSPSAHTRTQHLSTSIRLPPLPPTQSHVSDFGSLLPLPSPPLPDSVPSANAGTLSHGVEQAGSSSKHVISPKTVTEHLQSNVPSSPAVCSSANSPSSPIRHQTPPSTPSSLNPVQRAFMKQSLPYRMLKHVFSTSFDTLRNYRCLIFARMHRPSGRFF